MTDARDELREAYRNWKGFDGPNTVISEGSASWRLRRAIDAVLADDLSINERVHANSTIGDLGRQVERLTMQVERLTKERDEARAVMAMPPFSMFESAPMETIEQNVMAAFRRENADLRTALRVLCKEMGR